MLAGRRDGIVSSATEATSNLPASTMTVSDLLPIFNGKGLTTAQMVALSGILSSNLFIVKIYENKTPLSEVELYTIVQVFQKFNPTII